MDKNVIGGALYALPEGDIVRRRKPMTIPTIVFISGIALIGLNCFLPDTADYNNLRSSVALIAMVTLFTGGAMSLIRLFGSGGVPYHTGLGCYLKYSETYYDKSHVAIVTKLVNEGNLALLADVKTTNVPSVTVARYSSPDESFVAIQAFEYVDLADKPLTDLKVIRK